MILNKKILYIVGIPIGNFFDFSQRAIFILKKSDIVLSEDSKKTNFILKFLNIKNKIISLNIYNEKQLCKYVIQYINLGLSMALLSDSGTPRLNDPGDLLIEEAYNNNIIVKSIPGVSSLTSIISICKFNFKSFIFNGFFPKKLNDKIIFLYKIILETKCVIFFETSKRIIKTLLLIYKILPNNREIFIAKNLTKKFEENFHFKIFDIYKFLTKNYFLLSKGEFIIIINGFNNIVF
jgi:16S rRNA (cytidine1402-2'-O)-methyltransferase